MSFTGDDARYDRHHRQHAGREGQQQAKAEEGCYDECETRTRDNLRQACLFGDWRGALRLDGRQRGGRGRLRQLDVHDPGDRRITDSAIGASLVFEFEIEGEGVGCRADERQSCEHVAEIHFLFAEILVGLHLAGRQIELPEQDPVRVTGCGDLVLIQVVAVGDPDRDLDGVGIDPCQHRLKCLVDRQEFVAGPEQRAARRGLDELDFRAVRFSGQQLDRFGPGLRRIAEPDVGAALRLDDEIHRRRRLAGYRVGNADEEAVTVDLLHAKELVFVMQAGRQLVIAKNYRVRAAGIGHLAAVQVVAFLDQPVDLDGLAGIRHGIAVGLFGAKNVLVLGEARRQRQEQDQQCQDKASSHLRGNEFRVPTLTVPGPQLLPIM